MGRVAVAVADLGRCTSGEKRAHDMRVTKRRSEVQRGETIAGESIDWRACPKEHLHSRKVPVP